MRTENRHKRIVGALAGATALATVLAACGGGSSGSKSSGSSAAATVPATSAAPTGTPLTFGTISADSGPVILSSISDGTEAWAKYVNTHGGIAGHPVKIVRCDDTLDATKNQDCARQMIQNKSVLAVIGGETVVTPLVAAPLFNQSGLTYEATETTGAGEMTGKSMFAITGGAISQFAALASYFPGQGDKKVALVNAASPSSTKAAQQTTKEVQAAGGKVVATVFAAPGTPDYSPVATQLVSSGADVIVAGVTPTDLPALIRAIRQQSSTVKIATLASEWPATTVKTVGSQKDGIYMATDWAPFADDSTDPNVVALKSSLDQIGKSSSFGQGALSGWLGGKSIEAAINGLGADKVSRSALLNYLQTAQLSVNGIPVKLQRPQGSNPPGGYDGLANPSAYVNKWSGDTLTQVKLLTNVFSSSSS